MPISIKRNIPKNWRDEIDEEEIEGIGDEEDSSEEGEIDQHSGEEEEEFEDDEDQEVEEEEIYDDQESEVEKVNKGEEEKERGSGSSSSTEEEGDDDEEYENRPCPVSIHGRAGPLQQAVELTTMNEGYGEDRDFSTYELVEAEFPNMCRSTEGYKHPDEVEKICKVKAPVETFTLKEDEREPTSYKRSSLSGSSPVREKLMEEDLPDDSEVPVVSKDSIQNEPSPIIQEHLDEPTAPSSLAPSVDDNPQNIPLGKFINCFKRGSGQNDFWVPTQPPRKLTTAEKESRDAKLKANFLKFPYPEKFHPIVKGGSPWPGHSLTPDEMAMIKEIITID